ncbi:MAG: hypothetical protein AB7T59_03250 [Hyphomonadaceae bacterium]
MGAPPKPELGAAILKGAFIEAILLVLGGAVALNTGNYFWLIGAVVFGSIVMVLLVLQSGALKAGDDRR